MSRHPTSGCDVSGRKAKMADEYVNFTVVSTLPKAITLDEVEQATLKYNVIQQVVKAVSDGHWRSIKKSADTKLKSFYNLRHELTVAPNAKIVMRGSCSVIPATLQERSVALAHEMHQGIVKTKTLLLEKVWFPCIGQMTDNVIAIKRCVPCQSATPRTAYEPLNMTPLPETPWRELSTDFYGPLPTGEYLLVIIDEYSRYPVVEIVRSM